MIRRTLIAAVVLGALFTAAPAHGCMCARFWTDKDPRLSNGDAVPSPLELAARDLVLFAGEAVEAKADPQTPLESVTTFRVERHWEETLPEKVSVWTGSPQMRCGYFFVLGKQYVVFATRMKDGTLYTDHCSHTAQVALVPDLLEHVVWLAGEGRKPN